MVTCLRALKLSLAVSFLAACGGAQSPSRNDDASGASEASEAQPGSSGDGARSNPGSATEAPSCTRESEEAVSIPTARGKLSAREIEKAMKTRQSEVEKCYLDLVMRDDKARGKLEIRLLISAKGETSKVRASSAQLRDGAFLCCADKAYVGLKFPAPKGGDMSIVHGMDLDH